MAHKDGMPCNNRALSQPEYSCRPLHPLPVPADISVRDAFLEGRIRLQLVANYIIGARILADCEL
jgi:hypothetical protein